MRQISPASFTQIVELPSSALASPRMVLDRRQERADRRREHIAELNKRAAETDLRLKRHRVRP
jgi:hypothetical protein